MIVEAAQHVFSNVEKDQSPSNKGGFQTLFYSTSVLSPGEVNEIELHLTYQQNEYKPRKRCFFSLSSSKKVITQISPLESTDKYGRSGLYLAHSLIFSSETFLSLEANPFSVFSNYTFMSSIDDALVNGNVKTGDIQVVSFQTTIDTDCPDPNNSLWVNQDLLTLSRLALRTRDLEEKKISIAILGNPGQVEKTLSSIFPIIPAPMRQKCTFDTFFDGGNPVSTYYWAIGLTNDTANPRSIIVDVRNRSILVQEMENSQSAYERWYVSAMEKQSTDYVIANKERVFEICELIDGRLSGKSLKSAVPEPLIDSIFSINGDVVRERVRDRLSEQLSPMLAARLLDQIMIRGNAATLLKAFQKNFDTDYLVKLLYEVYEKDRFAAPPLEEINELGETLKRITNRRLSLLHVCWEAEIVGETEKLHGILASLSANQYRSLLRFAANTNIIGGNKLLIKGGGVIFTSVYPVNKKDMVELVKILIDNDEASCLVNLTTGLSELEDKDIIKLKKLIKDNLKVPLQFRVTLEKVSATRQSGSTITKTWSSLFHRKDH